MGAEPARDTIKFKRQTTKKKLNKRTIDSLKPPAPNANGKPAQAWYYDQNIARLAVCVWSTGKKCWYWVGRFGSQMIRFKLGNYPEMSPENAKKKAGRVSTDVGNGIDPRDEKLRERQEWTLAQLFEEYLEKHAKPRKKTWEEDEAQFDRYCGRLKNRRIGTINKADVSALHSKVGKSGKYAANRLLALLRKVFAFADEIGLKIDNPAKGIRKYAEESRDRFLNADELKRFFEALEVERTIFRDYFILLLLTGARRSNVCAMRFKDINFDAAVWRIPRTKNSDPLNVPLVPQAIEILISRRQAVEGDWVFPAKRGKTPHLTEPKTAWARIVDRAKLEGVRIHDIRRTHGSWMAGTGASLPIIGRSLGHKSPTATMIYSRLDVSPVRLAVETATAAMFAVSDEDKGSNVTETEPSKS